MSYNPFSAESGHNGHHNGTNGSSAHEAEPQPAGLGDKMSLFDTETCGGGGAFSLDIQLKTGTEAAGGGSAGASDGHHSEEEEEEGSGGASAGRDDSPSSSGIYGHLSSGQPSSEHGIYPTRSPDLLSPREHGVAADSPDFVSGGGQPELMAGSPDLVHGVTRKLTSGATHGSDSPYDSDKEADDVYEEHAGPTGYMTMQYSEGREDSPVDGAGRADSGVEDTGEGFDTEFGANVSPVQASDIDQPLPVSEAAAQEAHVTHESSPQELQSPTFYQDADADLLAKPPEHTREGAEEPEGTCSRAAEGESGLDSESISEKAGHMLETAEQYVESAYSALTEAVGSVGAALIDSGEPPVETTAEHLSSEQNVEHLPPAPETAELTKELSSDAETVQPGGEPNIDWGVEHVSGGADTLMDTPSAGGVTAPQTPSVDTAASLTFQTEVPYPTEPSPVHGDDVSELTMGQETVPEPYPTSHQLETSPDNMGRDIESAVAGIDRDVDTTSHGKVDIGVYDVDKDVDEGKDKAAYSERDGFDPDKDIDSTSQDVDVPKETDIEELHTSGETTSHDLDRSLEAVGHDLATTAETGSFDVVVETEETTRAVGQEAEQTVQERVPSDVCGTQRDDIYAEESEERFPTLLQEAEAEERPESRDEDKTVLEETETVHVSAPPQEAAMVEDEEEETQETGMESHDDFNEGRHLEAVKDESKEESMQHLVEPALVESGKEADVPSQHTEGPIDTEIEPGSGFDKDASERGANAGVGMAESPVMSEEKSMNAGFFTHHEEVRDQEDVDVSHEPTKEFQHGLAVRDAEDDIEADKPDLLAWREDIGNVDEDPGAPGGDAFEVGNSGRTYAHEADDDAIAQKPVETEPELELYEVEKHFTEPELEPQEVTEHAEYPEEQGMTVEAVIEAESEVHHVGEKAGDTGMLEQGMGVPEVADEKVPDIPTPAEEQDNLLKEEIGLGAETELVKEVDIPPGDTFGTMPAAEVAEPLEETMPADEFEIIKASEVEEAREYTPEQTYDQDVGTYGVSQDEPGYDPIETNELLQASFHEDMQTFSHQDSDISPEQEHFEAMERALAEEVEEEEDRVPGGFVYHTPVRKPPAFPPAEQPVEVAAVMSPSAASEPEPAEAVTAATQLEPEEPEPAAGLDEQIAPEPQDTRSAEQPPEHEPEETKPLSPIDTEAVPTMPTPSDLVLEEPTVADTAEDLLQPATAITQDLCTDLPKTAQDEPILAAYSAETEAVISKEQHTEVEHVPVAEEPILDRQEPTEKLELEPAEAEVLPAETAPVPEIQPEKPAEEAEVVARKESGEDLATAGIVAAAAVGAAAAAGAATVAAKEALKPDAAKTDKKKLGKEPAKKPTTTKPTATKPPVKPTTARTTATTKSTLKATTRPGTAPTAARTTAPKTPASSTSARPSTLKSRPTSAPKPSTTAAAKPASTVHKAPSAAKPSAPKPASPTKTSASRTTAARPPSSTTKTTPTTRASPSAPSAPKPRPSPTARTPLSTRTTPLQKKSPTSPTKPETKTSSPRPATSRPSRPTTLTPRPTTSSMLRASASPRRPAGAATNGPSATTRSPARPSPRTAATTSKSPGAAGRPAGTKLAKDSVNSRISSTLTTRRSLGTAAAGTGTSRASPARTAASKPAGGVKKAAGSCSAGKTSSTRTSTGSGRLAPGRVKPTTKTAKSPAAEKPVSAGDEKFTSEERAVEVTDKLTSDDPMEGLGNGDVADHDPVPAV